MDAVSSCYVLVIQNKFCRYEFMIVIRIKIQTILFVY